MHQAADSVVLVTALADSVIRVVVGVGVVVKLTGVSSAIVELSSPAPTEQLTRVGSR